MEIPTDLETHSVAGLSEYAGMRPPSQQLDSPECPRSSRRLFW